jgi:DNA-binding CsgD family transcriptional regulator
LDKVELRKIENIAIEDVRMLDLQSISSSSSTQSPHSSGEPSAPSLQDVLEASLDGVLLLTAQGEILHINNAALHFIEVLNSSISKDIPIPPEIWHIYQALIDGSKLSSNRAIIVESEISLESSYRIRVKAQWLKLKNDKDTRILIILQDERCSIRDLVLEEAQQYGLTGRETEVWLLCRSEKLTFKQIASELFITVNTLKKHIKNIYSKIKKSDLRSVAEEVTLQESRRTEQLMAKLQGVAGALTIQMQRKVDSR